MTVHHDTVDLAQIAHQAMLDHGLEPDFPPAALQQLESLRVPARESGSDLRDWRALLWCSIDNDTSKDLDQLTVAASLPGERVKVLVAIADVDALVPVHSPLDQHAQANTTSVYTAAKIFPMLPEKLSTDLTSLNESEDRVAMVIEMVVASDGSVAESDVYRALVKNWAKLAYRSVAAWLDGKGPMPEAVAKVSGMDEQLRLQDRVAHAMKALRLQHGALELESIEPQAVMKDGKVLALRLEKKNRAQDLIEDFMIAANGVSAGFLERHGLAALSRVVRSPERWDRIRKVAEDYGEHLPSAADSRSLAEFLARRRVADPLRFPDLSLTIVKLLGPGEYVLQMPGQPSPGHFGLAVEVYNHSTAPNRRYPDLITQRLLKAALAESKPPYTAQDLEALAAHCTQQEDAARKVERQVRKSAAALLLSSHVGEKFAALVTGAADKGTWIRLLDPPVEGKLVRGQEGLHVGDEVRVQLISLNVQRGFIDFVRAGS